MTPEKAVFTSHTGNIKTAEASSFIIINSHNLDGVPQVYAMWPIHKHKRKYDSLLLYMQTNTGNKPQEAESHLLVFSWYVISTVFLGSSFLFLFIAVFYALCSLKFCVWVFSSGRIQRLKRMLTVQKCCSFSQHLCYKRKEVWFESFAWR